MAINGDPEKRKRMKLVSFKSSKKTIAILDDFVRKGIYTSRSEAIRVAIRDLIRLENAVEIPTSIESFEEEAL